MPVRFQAVTDVGKQRSANEDSFLAAPELGLFVAADGMGGQAAGEVASRLAVDTICQFIKLTEEQRDITWPTGYEPSLNYGQNRLRSALMLANQEIYASGAEDAGLRGMGTTAVCALFEGKHVDLAHVGDSRIYLLHGNELTQITNDHSWIHEQVKRGVISEDQARSHPYRNVVTRALGATPDVDVDLTAMELEETDLLLLCTDGLNSMVSDQEISDILQRYHDDLDASAKALVYEANLKGGDDNITVILLGYSAD
ncbi:MAG TPA: Stp1/IreP family PP2C-type Ser/Thr phosphatase [Acidobacteriota bacterium]|nr:Stp1/IreP family PP2C-type Ser/Thr phosphatase [Acidobacteriota bacterium]